MSTAVAVESNAADRAIAFALAQVGKPYRWGATGPDAYDCSGLIYAAYSSAGVSVPRVTYSQIVGGQAVSPRDIAPGDLLFPEPGHVWMYLGNGKCVEAPHTGDVVKVIPLGRFIAARRYTAPASGHAVVTNAGFGWGDLGGIILGPAAPLLGGLGGSITGKGGGGALGGLLGLPGDALQGLEGLTKFFFFITNPHNWMRAAYVMGGTFILFLALIILSRPSVNAGSVVKVASKVAEAA